MCIRDSPIIAFHPRVVVIELHHRATGRIRIPGDVTANHRVIRLKAHQRQEGGRQINLTGNGAYALWLNFTAKDQARNVEILDRHQLVTPHTGIMVGDDQKYSILPVVLLARGFYKLAQRMVGIFHRVVNGVFIAVIQRDPTIGKFEGRVIGRGKYQTKKWLAGGMQLL